MSFRITWAAGLVAALGLVPVAGAGASSGLARAGVGDAWGPVHVSVRVAHAVVRAHRMGRTQHDHR